MNILMTVMTSPAKAYTSERAVTGRAARKTPPVFGEERRDTLKRIIALLILAAFLLSVFFVCAFADEDDNATGGDGDNHSAAEGYGWYSSNQYLYKVTIFIGKKVTVTKQSSLSNDFYRIGTVIMRKSGWSIPSNTHFADGTKMDYYSGTEMRMDDNPFIITDGYCPRIPIVCTGGDLDLVKSYFGSTGTLNTILNALANRAGTTAYGLLKNKSFTIGGVSKSGWSEADLLPNGTTNRVPWVIIYEPMIILHLKDKVNCVAFTATEFAIAEMNGWYDWHKSGGSGQNVSSLTDKHMPSSIQLEESWFGYPVYPVHSDAYRWDHMDTIKGGGWGMRWLSAQVPESTDYSVSFVSLAYDPTVGERTPVKIKWTNSGAAAGTVLCELYSNSSLVWSQSKTLAASSDVISTINMTYHSTDPHHLTARINYEKREEESDPDNNIAYETVTPVSGAAPEIDYKCTFAAVETPEPNSYAKVTINWENLKSDSGRVLCELYRDDRLIWSGNKSFSGNEKIVGTYNVYYSGTGERTLTARINYADRMNEIDPDDNLCTTTVQPVANTDDTYDFSVSQLKITPKNIYQGEYIQVDFVSDSWNKDVDFQNILVEVLVGNEVVKSELVDFEAYGRNNHHYVITMNESGTKTVTARINWEHRFEEDNSSNNSVQDTATVNNYYDFSIGNLKVTPTETWTGEAVTVTFNTSNNDRKNAYEHIPVQILYRGKVVSTQYVDYKASAVKTHKVTLNVGSVAGTHELYARINWQNHSLEVNPDDNVTKSEYVTVEENRDLSIRVIQPDSSYRMGVTVITSYHIYNNSARDVLPDDHCRVTFTAYYLNGSKRVIVSSQTWEDAVIPAYDTNLVYFKWTLPEKSRGYTVYTEAEISADGVIESDYNNNYDAMQQFAIGKLYSDTPDTSYERQAPSGFSLPGIPSEREGNATWSMWAYENGAFVKKDYGIFIYAANPVLTPDPDSPSSEKSDGLWTMKSGYGFTIAYRASIRIKDGYLMPSGDAYTEVQGASALFPEYRYSEEDGEFCSLVKDGSKWAFMPNVHAQDQERLHFTPLWFPDGSYIVSVLGYDVWTPAGMISHTVNSRLLTIEGSAYDDWYLGRS